MPKGQSLQDPFLNALRRERIPVSVYLVNGIKLQGTIERTSLKAHDRPLSWNYLNATTRAMPHC